jgi:NitT/TauT family transport system substrate-binding protein
MANKKVYSEPGSPVNSLPWHVALKEGIFADFGLDVEFVSAAPRDPIQRLVSDPHLIDSNVGHHPYEEAEAEIYRACEWGQIVRVHDSKRDNSRIIGKRAAVSTQAIIALPDAGITHPQDLRNKTIGVNFWSGSHYLTIQLLEGFLEDDEIKVVNIGGANRYEALLNREVDAVTVMEPWITIAEKQGALRIAEAHYVGSDIASDSVDPETFEAINKAIREAVRRINADKRSYVHYLLDDLDPKWQGIVTPDDFYLPRLRYVNPEPYPAGEFQKTYDWLVKWNLIEPDASFEDIVDNRISVAS